MNLQVTGLGPALPSLVGTRCPISKTNRPLLVFGFQFLGQILSARQTTTALWHYLPTCICVKDLLCDNFQSYPLHLVTQRIRYEHLWTDNMSRSTNRSEDANGLFESSKPCSYNSHSLWYWYIPFLRMVRRSAAGCWDRSSWLSGNPWLLLHQYWSYKLLVST